MRIVYVTAGAAGMRCGSCMRDAALARVLKRMGHDMWLVPMYTPLVVDGGDPSLGRVFYGGISVYLEQKSDLFRRMPSSVTRLLSRRGLLRLASKVGVETRPEELGEMTVSVLAGEAGRQKRELERLVDFLADELRPEIVNLSNTLISALAPAIRERLGVPVVATLQGEDAFVADLPGPHRAEALRLVRENCRSVGRFVAPAASYADEMARWLDVPRDRMTVVRPGVDIEPLVRRSPRPHEPFRVGYLSRLAPEKGLDVLADAFRELERRRPGAQALAVAGQLERHERDFWREVRAGLEAAGLAPQLEYAGEVDLAGKARFLAGLSVYVFPSRNEERKATALVEAMAAGLPVVASAKGSIPEIIELAAAGLVVEPDDPEALADALAELRDDPRKADRCAEAAAEAARKYFSSETMAQATLDVYDSVLHP